ncbi:tol-pal system protein YbgF [Niveispirillum sp.]|uniref:tol-pal system protein YbgF n=1 Tax=Niveispirillum sp. TaxID=1917217 RepID=UPI0025D60CFE|nr:tol-pal system protein YbgF [Niveispirillum sp.]
MIGLSNYRHRSWARLGGVPRDIGLVSDALKRQGFTVESATDLNREQILQRIDSFIEAHARGAGGRKNRLVVYIAGHGHLVEKQYGDKLGYLVPVDAPAPGDGSFESRSVSVDEINMRAQRMDNLHTLFILDSCFSGSIISGQSRASLPPAVEVKMGRPVRYFITAGEDEATVPDNGLFARILVEGLDGDADAGARDGFVTGSELGNYVQERVTTLSKGTQRPQFGPLVNERLSKGDIIFSGAGTTAAARAVKPPAPQDDGFALTEGQLQSRINGEETPSPLYSRNPPAAVGTAGPQKTESASQEQYDDAFNKLRRGEYQQATEAFAIFIKQNPTHPLTANAQYWMGESLYVRAQYRDAAVAFAEGYELFPKSQRAPDMLLKLSLSLSALQGFSEACEAINTLQNRHRNASPIILRRADEERQKLNCS